jgi:hypothetical protein
LELWKWCCQHASLLANEPSNIINNDEIDARCNKYVNIIYCNLAPIPQKTPCSVTLLWFMYRMKLSQICFENNLNSCPEMWCISSVVWGGGGGGGRGRGEPNPLSVTHKRKFWWNPQPNPTAHPSWNNKIKQRTHPKPLTHQSKIPEKKSLKTPQPPIMKNKIKGPTQTPSPTNPESPKKKNL